MNRTLIVHNNNISDGELILCEEAIKFVSINDTLKALIERKFDLICIKDNLSSNYLEFNGLLLAYHLRLSLELGHQRFIPIVILSDLDGYSINKLTWMGQILFTKHVFIGHNNKTTIEKYKAKNILLLSPQEYQNKFLNRIEIKPPQDSKNHSIANKWAIYRWARFLKAVSPAIDKNNSEIQHMLYFKYLASKYDIGQIYEEEPNEASENSKESGLKIVAKKEKEQQKILYIDDEWNKGWSDIFDNFFKKKQQRHNIFKTFEKINKDTQYDELGTNVHEIVMDYEPDLVILDMRIIEDDHTVGKEEKDLSGIKILKHIKEDINPGIQIIMLTASGKSKILLEAQKYDLLGYIKKEHPEEISVDTKETFEKLKNLLDTGLEKQYLKNIWKIQESILGLKIFENNVHHQIKLEIKSIFEILNSSMENKFVYAMLAIFKVLEIIKDNYINDDSSYVEEEIKIKAIVKNSLGEFVVFEYKSFIQNYKQYGFDEEKDAKKYYYSTSNKIHSIMFEKLCIKETVQHVQLNELTIKRNRTIHPNNSKVMIDRNNILEWFLLLSKILEKVNSISK